MPALKPGPRCIIVCASVHHGNTRTVAEAMASTIGATVSGPGALACDELRNGALLGLGSGIYFGSHHRSLLSFAESLAPHEGGRAFLFSTSGSGYEAPRLVGIDYHRKLRRLLEKRGYVIVGEFACEGYDTYGPWGLLGGIARGRPNEADLARARTFANGLRVHL